MRSGAESPDRTPEAWRAFARQICLRLLTTEPRTRAQLADAMQRRGVPSDTAEEVLGQLTDTRLVDDTAFAKAWVESRHYARGLSRRNLQQELRQRGVDDDDITDAVETLDPDQEIETARRLIERKLAGTRGQPSGVRARKAAGLLARKGYPAGLTFRLIRETMEREGADPADFEEFPEDLPPRRLPSPRAPALRPAATSGGRAPLCPRPRIELR